MSTCEYEGFHDLQGKSSVTSTLYPKTIKLFTIEVSHNGLKNSYQPISSQHIFDVGLNRDLHSTHSTNSMPISNQSRT